MGKKLTNMEFVNKLKTKTQNIVSLEEYRGNKIKIQFQCQVCQHKWLSRPDNILSGYGCPQCANKARGMALAKPHEQFVTEMSIIHPNIKVIEKYKGDKIKIKVVCSVCDYQWQSSPDNLVHRGRGCPYCAEQRRRAKRTKTNSQFIQKLYTINPNILAISPYVGVNKLVQFECKKCRNQWNATPDSVLNQKTGCPRCAKSKGERFIEQYLLQNDIKYYSQYKFADCKDTNPLPFDFYLPSYNICIEYQGRQHYEPVEIFGGQRQLEIQQKHDKIKREYCRDNDIQLIEIRYDEDMQQKLLLINN